MSLHETGILIYPTLRTNIPYLNRLATQLARTEEAAKRALLQSDPSAKGGAAQKLLDAERALHKLRDENAELRSSLARCLTKDCSVPCNDPMIQCLSETYQRVRKLHANLSPQMFFPLREKKKAADVKNAHDETKRRLENALRDQRSLSKRVGDVERKNNTLSRKPEDEFWGEEAGRRYG